MNQLLTCIEIEPNRPTRASVIWLHGLGADGHDFEPIVPELNLAPELGVRFVFPHAPQRSVTINGGYVMRAWYDILSFDIARGEDAAGIVDSASQVRTLIERERERGIAAERIVLAGFSQGGAIALYTGLRYPQRLAGIIALSTYLPLSATLQAEAAAANADIPILMCHGDEDTVIVPAHGEASYRHLLKLGYAVEWHRYAMPHSVCPQEIADIGRWLKQLLAD